MTTLAKLALLASLLICGCGGGSIQSASTDASADRGRHHVPPPTPGYTSTLTITDNRTHVGRHARLETCPFRIFGTSGTLMHDTDQPPTITLRSRTLDDGCTWVN